MPSSLFQNFNGSSKYNDDLTQHGTWHYELDAKRIRINEKKLTGRQFFKVLALLGHILENFWFNKKLEPVLSIMRVTMPVWSSLTFKLQPNERLDTSHTYNILIMTLYTVLYTVLYSVMYTVLYIEV